MKKLLLALLFILFFFPVGTAWAQGTLNLAWTDNSNNEDGFKIERKTLQTGTFVEVGQTGQDIAVFADAVPDGQLYCYRVNAFNSVGASPWSAEACGTILTTPLGPTTIIITITAP